jgi:hypothetical protein
MKTIPLSRGMVAKVDDADYPSLSRFVWWVTKGGASRTWYAQGYDTNRHCKVRMHNLIMGIDGRSYQKRVDHRNGDGLDNQRSNLRTCTHAQNMKNRRPRNPARFKGIYFHKASQKWAAEIVSEGNYIVDSRDQ